MDIICSGLSELSVLSQVSAVEGCPLSGVPLYSIFADKLYYLEFWCHKTSIGSKLSILSTLDANVQSGGYNTIYQVLKKYLMS